MLNPFVGSGLSAVVSGILDGDVGYFGSDTATPSEAPREFTNDSFVFS